MSGREYQESSVSPESLAPSPTTATRTAPTSALSSSEEIGRNPCLDTCMVTLSLDGIEEAYYAIDDAWRRYKAFLEIYLLSLKLNKYLLEG